MTSPPNITTRWNATKSPNNITPTKVLVKDQNITGIGGGGGGGGPSTTSQGEMLQPTERELYYDTNYKLQTGIRIATTLGGFFLLVLLTLLYKSKCKKHSTRDPTPLASLSHLPMNSYDHHQLAQDSDFSHQSNYDDDRLGILDSTHFININQIHPYNHYPINYNHNNTSLSMQSPALLLTAANSESSSDDEMFALSSSELNQPNNARQQQQCNINSNFNQHLNPITLPLPRGLNCLGGRLQQNIDIHVILPTPTISPSSSEHFGTQNHNHHTHTHHHNGKEMEEGVIMKKYNGEQRDRNRSCSVGSNNSNLFVNSFQGSSSFFLDNLKYVDDTSSENIPTNDEQDQDNRSIGSDSVFACFDHNFDHIAPGYGRRISSVSGYSGLNTSVRYPGLLTSNNSPRINKSARNSVSGDGSCGHDDEESEFKITLTKAQVHHRDSYCSEIESFNDYMEIAARRRSSSTQTNVSDLQQCLSLSWTGGQGHGQSSSPKSPRLSPNYSNTIAVHSHHHHQNQNQDKLSPSGPAPPQTSSRSPLINKYNRKQSVDTLLMSARKPYILTCDEPICLSTNSNRKNSNL